MTPDVFAAALVAESIVGGPSITDVRPVVDVREHLFDKQRAFVDDPARFKTAHPGRRSGKTHALVTIGAEAAQRHPGLYVPYLCLTAASARVIAWPVITDLVQRYDLGVCSDATMTAHFYNGAKMVCAGTDDLRHIATWRGGKLPAALIDECGSQPDSLLRTLVVDIIEPALGDLRGTLAMAGTPPPTGVGFWDDMINPERANNPIHHWDVRSNPYFPDPEGWLAETLARRRWREDNPTYQREYLGLRFRDLSALVMPFEKLRNGMRRALPRCNDKGHHLAHHLWQWVFTVDLGARRDSTGAGTLAIVVIATHPHDRHTWICRAEKHAEWIADNLVARLRWLEGQPVPVDDGSEIRPQHPSRIVDLGGLGVSWADEARKRLGMMLEPADKRDREAALRWAHDLVEVGDVQVLDLPECQPLVDEWLVLPWDDDRLDVAEGYPDHAHDAAFYGIKRARNYQPDKPKAPPKGSPEWYALEVARLERQAEERAIRTQPRKWYR